jgi:hypothetical protein
MLTYEEHGDDDAARHVGASGPTSHEEVDDEHGGEAGVAKLLVGVLRVQVVHRLLAKCQ